jgi:hypothetical protein
MWNLEGKHIKAMLYIPGEEVSGIVQESRVKYGGRISHTIKLDNPVFFKWRSGPVHTINIDSEEIISVRDEDMSCI